MDRFKQAIRSSCLRVRSTLSSEYRLRSSKQMCKRVQALHQYRYAQRIALYQAVKGEIDLNILWQSAPLQGKYCFFPSITEDKRLLFLPATPKTSFKPNAFGVLEPDVDPALAILSDQLDLILLPVVAFDGYGTRLGYGAGYYDRTLAHNTQSVLLGVAYEFQHQDFLRREPWDVPLHATVTQRTIYWSKTS